jgi:hypothetical protein
MILHFAVFIFAPLVCRNAEATHGRTLGGIAQLGIATEISHQNYFVKGHEEPFFSNSLTDTAILLRENLKNQANQIFKAINLLRCCNGAHHSQSLAIAFWK